MNLKSAYNLIIAEKKAREGIAEQKYRKALLTYPLLLSAEKKVREAILDGTEKDIALAEKNKREVIIALGLDEKEFTPLPVCEKCGDSGIFEGYYCECVKKRMAKESINSPIPPFTFEESDLSLFRKDKELAERAYETMRIFCAKFPHTKNVNLLFIGNAGTGKTFLASCVANELERQGRNVLFLSAFRFNDICLKYHTSFDNARTDGLNAVIDAELLVIDDLGTESILKNVTKEYLYTVISERMNAGRHTIITTNLNESMLEARYGERIVSRLFTTRACLTLALTGEDLRR